MGINVNTEIQFNAWIACARAVRIEDEVARRGIRLKRQGRELIGPCPRCGGTDRFAANIAKQIWNCRGCGKGGDTLDLVQHLDACDFLIAVRTLTGEPPPHGGNGHKSDPAKIAHQLAQRQEQRADEQRQDAIRQRDKARWLWRTAQPAAGTIVESYLRSRGITVALPATIRFLPARDVDHHPAMIVPYVIADEPEPGELGVDIEKIVAVHVTLLKPDGSGKADVQPNKKTLGSPSGRPLVLAPMNELMGLAICEGIEDALSIHQATGLGAWAAGCAGYMPKLIAAIEALAGREEDASPNCITVFVDDDEAGRRGAHELADALTELSAKFAAATIPPTTAHFEILLKDATP